jgi:hypothetical protein
MLIVHPLWQSMPALRSAFRHRRISVVRHAEVMAADSNGMQRFLFLKCAKARWTKWQNSVASHLGHQNKEPIMNNNMYTRAGTDTAVELEGKASVIHGFARPGVPQSQYGGPDTAAGSGAVKPSQQHRYEIRYQSLYHEGRALSFPCDAQGHVEMDALSEKARMNYLYARAVVGREYAAPAVCEADLH